MIGKRWAVSKQETLQRRAHLSARIGFGIDGPIEVDLVADGPHALVGGTTGSGKSELLRTLVSSLAVSHDPDHLTFLLVDYKGGSAFDACAGFPHTVGLITDLDPGLAARAVVCLEAELVHRERVLRSAGVDDITSYQRLRLSPLPRLVVVIDEFATLVNDLPDFVDALVNVAQRGRSLGVHLVLATQRPNGAINDNIRTNTNLRIALRMLDASDSIDVIGSDIAASIGRDSPGRAFVRRGPNDLDLVQSALVTGAATRVEPIASLVPVSFGAAWRGSGGGAGGGDIDQNERSPKTELAAAVAAATKAASVGDFDVPRRPWTDPLPDIVVLADVVSGSSSVDRFEVPLGWTDLPEQQRRDPLVWCPGEGNLVVCGRLGSGVTETLRTAAVSAMTAIPSPSGLHVHVVDCGTGGFVDLSDRDRFGHVGSIVGVSDVERVHRLFRLLARSIGDRRERDQRETIDHRVLLIIDGLDVFRRRHQDDFELLDLLDTVCLEGPTFGVHVAAGAQSPASLRALRTVAGMRVYLELVDGADLHDVGAVPLPTDSQPPGRGHVGPAGHVVQVALVHDHCPPKSDVHNLDSVSRPPVQIGTLPALVPFEVAASFGVRSSPDMVDLGVGLDSLDLEPMGFSLACGDHVLVAGPRRSGKTTALLTIASTLSARGRKRAAIEVRWLGESPDPLLCAGASVAELRVLRDRLLLLEAESSEQRNSRLIVLVDDADTVEDVDGFFADVLSDRRSTVAVVAAGRPDRLRSSYGHWTNEFRQLVNALLLWPDVLDGDLVGADLPGALLRSAATRVPGRGVLVDRSRAVARTVQTAWVELLSDRERTSMDQ